VPAPDDAGQVEPLVRLAYRIGLGIPLLALLSLGWLASTASLRGALGVLTPDVAALTRPSGLVILASVIVTFLAGAAAWRFEEVVRTRTDAAGALLTPLVRLDWLYRLVWGVVRLLGAAVYNVAAVLEGEGAVLWMLVAVLVIWLLLR
jgi:hypothetical protein